jgi:transposase
MKELTSPIMAEAVELRKQGKSIKDIAQHFGVSVATVSTSLPYEDKFENSAEPSKHAVDLRYYRAYEKKQMKRQSELKLKYVQEINDNTKSNVINIKDSKEWQKDIKMSYIEAYNRPHRKTWEELEALDDSFIDSLSEAYLFIISTAEFNSSCVLNPYPDAINSSPRYKKLYPEF